MATALLSITERSSSHNRYTLMAHGLDLASAEWFRSCFIMTCRAVGMADARLSRRVGAGFHGPGGRFGSVEQVLGGSLAGSGQRLDAGEDRHDLVGPRPGGREVEPAAPGAAGERGGRVQDPVLQCLGFGLGELPVTGQ